MNLDVYNLEGINKEDFSEIRAFIQSIPSLCQDNVNQKNLSENLKILFRHGRFSILYSNQMSLRIEKEKIDLINLINYDKLEEKINVISQFTCEYCKKDSEIIQIKKLNNLSFCSNCLKNYLTTIIGKRNKNLIKENYYNKECNLKILHFFRLL